MVLNTGVCPQCNVGMLRRNFRWPTVVWLVIFLIFFFPVALLIFFSPDYLYCRHCGARFD